MLKIYKWTCPQSSELSLVFYCLVTFGKQPCDCVLIQLGGFEIWLTISYSSRDVGDKMWRRSRTWPFPLTEDGKRWWLAVCVWAGRDWVSERPEWASLVLPDLPAIKVEWECILLRPTRRSTSLCFSPSISVFVVRGSDGIIIMSAHSQHSHCSKSASIANAKLSAHATASKCCGICLQAIRTSYDNNHWYTEECPTWIKKSLFTSRTETKCKNDHS